MSERAVRVGEQLRADLMNLLLRGRLRDPATKDVVITAVRMSPDLQHARVYVRTLTDVSERKQQRVVDGLDRAAGFLRRELGKTMRLRRTPELAFAWDKAIDHGAKIEKIFAELDAEKSEDVPSDSDDDGDTR